MTSIEDMIKECEMWVKANDVAVKWSKIENRKPSRIEVKRLNRSKSILGLLKSKQLISSLRKQEKA